MIKYLAIFLFLSCLSVADTQSFDTTHRNLETDAGATPVPSIDTSGTDCSDAALLALVQPNPASLNLWGPTVDLPTNSRIRICQTLTLLHAVRIRGNGAQILISAVDVGHFDAIEIKASNTAIENLEIRFEAGSTFDHESIAISVKAPRTVLRDIIIASPGYGVVARATSETPNVNLQRWDNISVVGCKRVGLELSGIDASGGIITGANVQACVDPRGGTNRAVGLLEATANGNLHQGHNLEINDVSLRMAPTGGVAPSTFIGVYIEGGDPVEFSGNYVHNSTTVGGHLSTRNEVKGDRIGAANSRLSFKEVDGAGTIFAVQIPSAAYGSALAFSRNVATDVWLLKGLSGLPSTSRWGFQQYFSQSNTVLGLESSSAGGSVIINNQSLCYNVDQCL